MEANNAAALREALINIAASVRDESEDTELPCVAYSIARRVRRMAEAALAKPPRNCDVFKTESERRSAFIAYFNEAYDLKGSQYAIDTCDLKHNADGILHDYIEWLFAPAKKGDNDESK